MDTVEDEETKRAKRILVMVSLWVCHSIRYFRKDFSVVFLYPITRLSSASMDPILYQLLPYMSQSNPDVKPIVSGDFTNDTKDLGLDLSDSEGEDGQMDMDSDENSMGAVSGTADDSR